MLSVDIKLSHDEARLVADAVANHYNDCGVTHSPDCKGRAVLAQGLVDRLEATLEYINDAASEAAADMAGEIEPDDAE